MNTSVKIYVRVTTLHASLDCLEPLDRQSVGVDHPLLSQDGLADISYGKDVAYEQDVSCDNPDCLWEPPIVLDQDAEDAYKQWKESFEYFIKNGSGIEPMDRIEKKVWT